MNGQVALITGPARGIGAAVARGLAARGVKLALVGLEPDRLAPLAAEVGGVWFECDVTDQASLESAVQRSVEALGGIDVVVANAGIASHGSVASTPMDALARVIDVNLTGVVRTVKATLPHVLARKGYYLLVSSAAAVATSPGLAVYSATKIGVEHFGNALRVELAPKGVRVGSAHPCWIDTDMVRDAQHEMSSFNALLRTLPGPFGKVTSLETCAAALVEAIEKRKRKVFVPKSLGRLAVVRPFFMSPLAEKNFKTPILEQMEKEAAVKGSAFGEHSVERR